MSTTACQAHFNQFVCCCGADTVHSIYRETPEAVITKFIKTRVLTKRFDYRTNRYEEGGENWKLNVAFLLFAGPDFQKGVVNMDSYKGPKLLADYIRERGIGTIVQSSHRWNPMHPERKAGEGDLVIYIWQIDEPALKAWWELRNPLTGTALATLPTKVEPKP